MSAFIQPPYTILVANLSRSAGDDGAPTKARIGFTQQTRVTYGEPIAHSLVSGAPAPSSATLVVADNDFTSLATLTVGEFDLVSGLHYVVGGSAAVTATNIAAAIHRLPGFTAPVPGASTISVTGPGGPVILKFEVLYRGAVTNFTLTPDSGYLTAGSPAFSPPRILA